jgi:prepilin-type N-terminal cleavage/methylation domain-containing protein
MTQRIRTLRLGFTLFELLVVLALLALFFGLFLPAIFQARKAAARNRCGNNLRQIDLATINAADTYQGKLPPLAGPYPIAPTQPGQPVTHGSLFYHILPYIEQENLYKSGADDKGNTFSAWNGGVYSKSIATYICPNDGSNNPPYLYEGWLATAGYAANFLVFGDTQAHTMDGHSRFPASIADGTSQTIFLTERYQLCNGTPNAWAYDGQSSWTPAFCYASAGEFQTMPAEHQCDPDRAESPHAGGINIGLGDGSARFVSDKVSPRTWRAACTPAEGDILGADW